MAFTGQLLRWDEDAFWSIVVAAGQAAQAPLFGHWLASLVVAGANVGGATLPTAVTRELSGPARTGADLFVSKSCIACHSIGGSGGRRGPDLSRVGARLSRELIMARIAAGGAGMPAFAGSLNPSELDYLMTFLETRR